MDFEMECRMIISKKEGIFMKNRKCLFSMCVLLLLLFLACSSCSQDRATEESSDETIGITEESPQYNSVMGLTFNSVEEFHQAVRSAKPKDNIKAVDDISTVEEYYVLTALPDFGLGEFYVTSGMIQCQYFPKDILVSSKTEVLRYRECGGYALTTYRRDMEDRYEGYSWEKERERLLSIPGYIMIEDKYVVNTYMDVCSSIYWKEDGAQFWLDLPDIDLTKVDVQELVKLCAVEKVVISK